MRNLFLRGRDWNGHVEGNWLVSRGVAWWQRAWDLHSRSRVRVRTYTSCKSLGQLGFYSLTWTHKIHFPESEVSSNSKKKKRNWLARGTYTLVCEVSRQRICFIQCQPPLLRWCSQHLGKGLLGWRHMVAYSCRYVSL
jgi:hypothetical protein